jgi:hypothetical protein
VIFTEPARTEVPTTVETIFTDKALALDISDHPTDQDGVTAEGIMADGVTAEGIMADGVMAEGIMAEGVMAEGIMAEGVMAEGVMAEVGTSKRGHYLCRLFHNK